MTKVTLDLDTFGLTSLVEKITGVEVKDCFTDGEFWYVVVPSGEVGRLIGKQGMLIRKIEQQAKKYLRIIEFHEDPLIFIKNIVYPLKISQVYAQEKKFVIVDKDRRVRAQLLGHQGKLLSLVNRAVQRFFPGMEVKVENG
ncbi:KH domain-containing protein [Candidatus Woesearchaeota archaeon]|nr:KH domain-containing protein [Candidatus Woesearchaeota archaeon]